VESAGSAAAVAAVALVTAAAVAPLPEDVAVKSHEPPASSEDPVRRRWCCFNLRCSSVRSAAGRGLLLLLLLLLGAGCSIATGTAVAQESSCLLPTLGAEGPTAKFNQLERLIVPTKGCHGLQAQLGCRESSKLQGHQTAVLPAGACYELLLRAQTLTLPV